jgi:molybdopterin-containing oxidoreductase family iron-sulfur binding subunit
MDPRKNKTEKPIENNDQQGKQCGRRQFLKGTAKAAALGGAAMLSGCGMLGSNEELSLRWDEYFKKNYRLMSQEEKDETVLRLEKLAKIRKGVDIQMSSKAPIQGTDRRSLVRLCL